MFGARGRATSRGHMAQSVATCCLSTLCKVTYQPGFLLNGSVQTAEIQRRILPAGGVFPRLFTQDLGAIPAPDWPGSLLISGDMSAFAMSWWHGDSMVGL